MADKTEVKEGQELDTEKLLERFDEKKQELEDKRQEKNPEGRLSGNVMFNMYFSITGQNPFTGQAITDNNDRVMGPQLGSRRYQEARLFDTKLNKNRKELAENLTVIQGLFPKMDEEQKQQLQECQEKRKELVKEYSGIEDLSQFTDEEVEALIENQNNMDDFEKDIEKLDEEYEEIIDLNKKHSEEREEIMKQPLSKCNFDMITEEDVQQAGLSVKEQQAIDPMLDF